MTWYNTGTVKTTANSAIVAGTNTAWITSGLRPGDMLLIGYNTVSPRPFEIKSIDSATQITLVIVFPVAVTAAAYVGIPMLSGDRTVITMTLAQQVTKAFADNQAMQAVWQTFYSGSGTVSLTMPDGSIVTGSSFLKLTADMANKASLVSGAVPINQGGTGATSAATALSNLGAAPKASPTFTGAVTASTINLSGNASVLGSGQNIIFRIDATDIASISGSGIYTNSSVDARGCYKSRRGQGGDLGANYWSYFWDGSDIRAYVDTSNLGALAFKPASDALLKKDKVYQDTESYLSEVLEWRPATFKYIERGVIPESDMMLGFIANDLVKVSPECVTGEGLKEGFDPLNPEGAYGLDQIAMIAKLAGAIHAQQVQIDVLKKELMKLSQD